jgi:predicted NAD-dependent protein-ADP-ribosyltransferase YbiA (DUF1768 family)
MPRLWTCLAGRFKGFEENASLQMGQATTINFYKVSDPFGEFSNFAGFPFKLNGVVWPTAEHYFQAQKFAGTEHEEAVRLIASPEVV